MLKYILFTFSLLAFANSGFGQGQKFFKDEDLMPVGVYYYPEAWPKSQWERDFKKMADMGFEFTHFAEFAWAFMEPEEGKYNFGWLDTAIAMAAKQNLKVILCTPTPTPPAWMITKYPDIAMTNREGVQLKHGTRAHASWSSEKYREFTTKIVAELGKRYGQDKRIWGWQLDNEPSHYNPEYDYSASAQAAYRLWVKDKYKELKTLNMAWGTSFWSQVYSDWAQIRIPNEKELVHGFNPHQMLDFKRFQADECASFLRMQQATLRKAVLPSQWITSNFMGYHYPVDQRRSRDLDIVTYTTYPVAGYAQGVGEQGFRMSNPFMIPWLSDFFRSINGSTGAMELQPGQVNWGRYNSQPMPGAVRMWLMSAFAGGCKFACAYRFRQPLSGSELYHYGMVGPDGVTASTGGLEYSQVCKEIKQLRKDFDPKAKMPDAYAKRKVALLYNSDNIWDVEFAKQSYQFSINGHIQRYYTALKQMGCPVDVLDETQDFSAYPTLVAPAYQLLDKNLVDRWKTYVEAGGNLVLTCRTAQKNRNGQLWEAKYQAPILDLIGAEINFFDMLPENQFAKVKVDGTEYQWNNWADVLTAKPGTEIWGTYADQYYAGKQAITHRKLGKGTVTYVGVDTDDGKLEKLILAKLLKERKIETDELPLGIYKEWRQGFWIACNYNSDPVSLGLATNTKFILGGNTLKPAEVAIWKQ